MAGSRGKRGPGSKDEPPRKDDGSPKRWLFFRNQRDGRLKAKEELAALGEDAKAGLTLKMQRHARGESRRQDIDHLGGGIYEIRHRIGNNHYRVLFFQWGSYLVALTAFYKNQQATPKADLDRARTRAARWKEVFGKEPD